jgi:hypothetical protein
LLEIHVCFCRNDLLGLDGMVTQKNPDENVNHLPSAAPCVVDGVNATAASADINDSNKRYCFNLSIVFHIKLCVAASRKAFALILDLISKIRFETKQDLKATNAINYMQCLHFSSAPNQLVY